MSKKAISLLLVLGMLLGHQCSVSADVSVSGLACERNGNELEFSGSTANKNTALMLKIYNSEYGETQASGFVYLDTVNTGADGTFSVTVTMPETLSDGSSATGEYIMVYSDGSGSDTSTFMHTVPSEAADVYEALATKTADELKTEFAGSFADEAELAGVDITAYNKLSDDDKKVLLQWFAKQRTDVGTDNINLLNDCIYIKYISICGADELDEIAATINPAYGDYVYNNLTEAEKQVAAKYLASVKYSEYGAVNEAFGTAMVLIEISGAKAADITDLINDNAELLGLTDNGAYENYTYMSASDRLKVNEKLVSAIVGSVTSVSGLIDNFEKAVNKVKELSNSGSTSGGGGGSSWDSSNLNAPIVSKYDKPQSVDNANQGKTEVSFTDISNVPWATTAINYFASNGVVDGYNSTTFAPNDLVTREVFVKILLSASGLYEEGHTSSFGDVNANEWYAGYVACAQAKGIVNGVSDAEFGIGTILTRQDMAVLVLRTALMQGKKLTAIRGYKSFSDQNEISGYAEEAVKTLYCAGLLNGMGDGTFSPKLPLTRAQAVKVLYDVYSGNAVLQRKTNVSEVSKIEFEKRAEFLDAVGILNKNADEYSPSETITLGAMVNMALNLTEDCSNEGDEIDDLTEVLALNYDMVSEGYKSSETISVNRAVEIMVKAMGYGPFVENGDFIGKGSEIGLLKGVSATGSNSIDASVAMQILENATECSPFVVMDINSASKSMKILSDTNMLEYKKDTYKHSGIVTGNNLTTIYEADGVPEGFIEVDGTKYICENDSYGDYLGMRVTYYVRENKDDDVLKYVVPRDENETATISSYDFIDISDDFRRIEYYNGNRSKTITLDSTPRTFYNGRFYSGLTKEDFNMDMGIIRIVESYGSDEPDLIFVTEYETFVTDRVSNDGTIIYNKYSHSGVTEKLELEQAEYRITKSGEEIDISDIKEWDILSVAATVNGSDTYYEILVSDTVESARAQSYSANKKTVTSIGFIYDIAGSYFDSFAANKGVGYAIEMGEYQLFRLDAFDRVVVIDDDSAVSVEPYAYIIKVWIEERRESFEIIYFDVQKEEMIKATLAKNISINNKSCRNIEAVLNSVLFDGDQNVVPQLVKIEVNRNGLVSGIETAENATTADKTKFTKKKVSTLWTYENSSFNHEIFLTDEAKILCIPDSNKDINDYYVLSKSEFDTDSVYSRMTNVTAYDFDDFYRSDMIVVDYATQAAIDMTDSLQIFMVDTIMSGLTNDGDVLTKLGGSIGNYEGMEFFVVNDEAISGVQEGDALYVKFNNNGQITHAQKIFSVKDLISGGNIYEDAKTTYSTTRNAKTQYLTGWLNKLDLNSGEGENMLMLDGTTMIPVKLNGNSSKVIVYDVEQEKATVEDINALEKGDLLIIRMRYSVIKAIVAIKNIDIE